MSVDELWKRISIGVTIFCVVLFAVLWITTKPDYQGGDLPINRIFDAIRQELGGSE